MKLSKILGVTLLFALASSFAMADDHHDHGNGFGGGRPGHGGGFGPGRGPGPGPGWGRGPGRGGPGFNPGWGGVYRPVPVGRPGWGHRPGWGYGGGWGYHGVPARRPLWWRHWAPVAAPIGWSHSCGWGGWGNWKWAEFNRVSQLELQAQTLENVVMGSEFDPTYDQFVKQQVNQFAVQVQAFRTCLQTPRMPVGGCIVEKTSMDITWNTFATQLEQYRDYNPTVYNQYLETQNALNLVRNQF